MAIWGDKVFVGALDGRLIALNAKTGKVAWSTQTFPKTERLSITGAPRVIKPSLREFEALVADELATLETAAA